MTHIEVATKMIQSASYDRESTRLVVVFRPWHIEEFRDVPQSIVAAWGASQQPDDFFDRRIRRRFDSRPVAAAAQCLK